MLAQYIRNKGFEEGIHKGIQQGLHQGIQQGIHQGIEQGIQQGLHQGIQQGLRQGLLTGAEQKVKEMVLKMHRKGMSVGQIADLLELPPEQVDGYVKAEDTCH